MIYSVNGVQHDSDFLAHHGILGMKWGARRYQNTDGSLTAEGRRRYKNNETVSGARHEPSIQRKRYKEAKKKETILKKGKASDILKIKDQLTREEMQDAYNRLNLEQNIRNIANQEPKPKTTFQKIDAFMKNVGTVANWADNATKFYTNVNKFIDKGLDDKNQK